VGGCIEDSINLCFEKLVSKYNTGGKMEEVSPLVLEEVKRTIENKQREFEE